MEGASPTLIKDFDRFMTNKTKHHSKKHFCKYCLRCFSSSNVLKCQAKNCITIDNTKSVLLPEEGTYINFQNSAKLTKAPLIIDGDAECILIPFTDNTDFVPNTKIHPNHIVCSYD